MIVRFRLRFAPQDSQPLSSAREEEALRHGLAAALHKQGLSLPTYGTISSASLAGAVLPAAGQRAQGALCWRGHHRRSHEQHHELWPVARVPRGFSSRGFPLAEAEVLPGTQTNQPNALPGWQCHQTAAGTRRSSADIRGGPQVPSQCCLATLCPAGAASGSAATTA